MNAFFIICGAAALAFFPVPALQAVLATMASTLFESTPFSLAGVLLAGAASGRGAPGTLLGCGCSGGPGALALPVFAATFMTLGPIVASHGGSRLLGFGTCAEILAQGTCIRRQARISSPCFPLRLPRAFSLEQFRYNLAPQCILSLE